MMLARTPTAQETAAKATLTDSQERLRTHLGRLTEELQELRGMAHEEDYVEMELLHGAMSGRLQKINDQIVACRQAADTLRRFETVRRQEEAAQAAAEAELAQAPEGDVRGLPPHLRPAGSHAVMDPPPVKAADPPTA